MPEHMIGRQLMESAPRANRGVRPLLLSTAVHAVVVALSIWATLGATPDALLARAERVEVVDVGVFHSTPPAAPRAARRAEQGFKVLEAPREIPTTISLASLKEPSTIPEDFSVHGVAGAETGGIVVSPVVVLARSDEPIDGALADQPPYMLPGQMGPMYPAPLRNDAPDGLVVVRFVIDTLGRVESPSLDIVQSSHPLFLASVRNSLDHLRFLPARFSGRRVRVRMEQRFEFHLAGR